MPLLEEEAFESLEEILQEIRELSSEGVAIVVEGKNDEKSLRELDIKGPILQFPSGGKTPLNSIENLSHFDKVIILTDFDRTGEELAEYCRKHLEKLGVEVLFIYRDKLRSIVRKAVKDIEGLSKFVKSETLARENSSN